MPLGPNRRCLLLFERASLCNRHVSLEWIRLEEEVVRVVVVIHDKGLVSGVF